MLDLLKTFSWQELKHHPWRNAAAVVAVMLGVALAFSGVFFGAVTGGIYYIFRKGAEKK